MDVAEVDSCRLGQCLRCGTPWPSHAVPGCTGTYPRIMEHRKRVEAEAEDLAAKIRGGVVVS